jgi:hypothetical protein
VIGTMTRSFASGLLLLGFVGGCTGAGDSSSQLATVDVPRGALNASPQLGNFVILADNSLRIQTGGNIAGGDVGARGTVGPFLSGNVAADLLTGVHVQTSRNVIADSLRLGTGVVAGDVQTNHLTQGTGVSRGGLSGAVPLPALPAAAPVAPGAANLTVANGVTVTASASAFATVTVGTGATLRWPAGTYQLRDVVMASGARLEALGAVQIRIANRLSGMSGAYIGPKAGLSLTAKDIRLEVSGQDGASGTLGSTPVAVSFTSGATVNALVLVPRGTLQLGTGVTANGAFLAKNFDGGGAGAHITFQDGFAPACTAASCDDGNLCTSDTCGATGCTHANVTDGAPCTDGNTCTTGEACHAGACSGGAPVVCPAADSCHTAGACVPGTGCPAPASRPNGTPCNDGNACTQTDTCVSGVCSGGAPVICVAHDQCHAAGSCNPMTGACSNPPAVDGTGCSDGNACTQADVCQTGACVGLSPVACVPIDACHQGGVCDPQTGSCSNPTSPPGTTCAGGNVCDGAGACVQCLVSATCPGVDGACAARTCTLGVCGQTFSAGGTACGTGLACDGAGACVALCTPTTCAAQGKNCGMLLDGCGGTLSCGSCAAPDTCGGASVPNVCGAPPRSCKDIAWTRQLGGATGSDDVGAAIATDAAGNVYVAGRTQGLDGNPSAGFYDAFLVKYDTSGARLWTRQFGSNGADQALGVATSTTGKVYVTGVTDGTFSGGTNAGAYDMFVAQYDTDGNPGWAQQIGTISGDVGYAIATDAGGNVFVGGETGGDLNGGVHALGSDLFVIKLDASGNRLWSRQLGAVDPGSAIQNATGRGVATDAGGSVFVSGFVTGGSFDGHASFGQSDVVLAKFDAIGNKLWTRQFGSPGFEYVHGLASDEGGNVYVAGQGYDSLDGNPPTNTGGILLIKYDGAGNRIWTRQRASTEYLAAYGVGTDRQGGVFVTGTTTASLDGNPSAGDGLDDLFVTKYDTSGNWVWSYQRTQPGEDLGIGVATDGQGGVLVAGAVTGDVIDNHTSYDSFVVKFDQLVCGP